MKVQERVGKAKMNAVGRRVGNSVACLLLGMAVLPGIAWASPDPNSLPPSITTAPLSVDQVVDNLVRKNEERAQALRHSEATRVYRLVYRGFPGDREAEMTVEASYESPSTKDFKVISQSGSKLIVERVFKKLLESEKEAAQPEMRDRTLLNRNNYEFALVGYEAPEKGGLYILEVSPRNKSKYVYRGKIWVDGADFAVTRIEAEPAQNPSFWTKKSEIRHEYVAVQGFWLPARNESVSYIRLGGRATLTIEYKNYHLTAAPMTGYGGTDASPNKPGATHGSPSADAAASPHTRSTSDPQ